MKRITTVAIAVAIMLLFIYRFREHNRSLYNVYAAPPLTDSSLYADPALQTAGGLLIMHPFW